jgi:hypothetical protein
MNQGYYLTLMMGPMAAVAVPRDVVEALESAEVTSTADQRSGFQLTFAAGKMSRIVRELLPAGFFDPTTRVILVLTVAGQATTLMDGVITRHEYAPGNDPGQSKFTVTGVDVSQMMDLIDASGRPWPAMPPEARVALILAQYAVYGIIPNIIPSPLLFIDNPLDKIASQRGTDYQYIRKLAEETGYVFYIEPGPTPGVNFGYWGPEIKFSAPQRALSVNMDAHTNVESLSFSFDGLGKKQFIFYVQIKESKTVIPIPVPDISPLNPPLGIKQPMPLSIEFLNRENDKDATSKRPVVEAAMRGLARTSQAADVITASGSLDVTRYGGVLKSRQLVGVRGAGPAYDGQYYVRSVSHKIGRGSYKQNFSLTRNAHISLTSQVAV